MTSAYYPYVTRDRDEFPKGLRDRSLEGLWVRGGTAGVDALGRMNERPAVAVVGARACSDYGALVARQLARELAQAGVTVVSGLARGVDAHAHRGALEAGGCTCAVLGTGIDQDYPAANAELARRIAAEGGVVVSEYEPTTRAARWRFPQRNRLIAGIADALVVVEARPESGSLIAAEFALRLGRPVLAVPGPVNSNLSKGTNALLAERGALVCRGAADVFAALLVLA